MMKNYKLIIYTDQFLDDPEMSKTAHCILRFSPERVKAIYDVRFANKPLGSCTNFDSNIPIIDNFDSVNPLEDAIVISFAPIGGKFSAQQKLLIEEAIKKGVYIINGLHEFIESTDNVINLRAFNKSEKYIAQGVEYKSIRILTVGTSHSIGKMTATLQIHNLLKSKGISCTWIATGQTGYILAGKGRVIDAIPIDFVPGHIEKMILDEEDHSKFIFIEGQGSIFHPSYSPTAFGLYHASKPQYLILCHRLKQDNFWGFSQLLPSIKEAINSYRIMGECLNIRSTIIGISLDSSRVTETEYLKEKEIIEKEFGIACFDPIRFPNEIPFEWVTENSNAL